LRATWGPSSFATGYEVTFTLRNGVRLSVHRRARQRSASLSDVRSDLGISVAVAALGPDGSMGPRAITTVSPPRPPARVAGITIKRSAGGGLLRWRPAARAARYMIRVTIGKQARLLVTTGQRLRLTGLPRGGHAVITIRAINTAGQLGPVATIRYTVPSR
jgi:hypothetical protein